MATARCAYCNATLMPNSAYCLECGQLIPQAAVAVPVAPVAAASAEPATPARDSRASGVPLPGSLPWQGKRPVDAPETTPPVPTRVESVELVLPTGERVRVSGTVVLGRQPADTAHAMGARSIAVDDTTRSVSRVHMFLHVADGQVTVADAGSVNGSRLQRGKSMYRLESGGSPLPVGPGDTVWLGDVALPILP